MIGLIRFQSKGKKTNECLKYFLLLTQSNTKETPVSLPVQLKAKYSLVQTFARQIAEHRQIIQNILAGKDQRLMVITGPCSIH